MPTFCLVPDSVTGTRVWPWFFSGLNNETPPSSSAGLTPPPGWRGALGDLPGFRREGRGGGRPGGRGPCPHPLAPGASVVPVRPPLGAVPVSLPLGSLALCGASAPHEASFPSRPGTRRFRGSGSHCCCGDARSIPVPVRLAEQRFGSSCVPGVPGFPGDDPR